VDRAGALVLFDATPDMVSQLATLNGGTPPRRCFSHLAHIGHYTGLMFLVRIARREGRPVYGTERMSTFLRANGPWSQLVTRGNVA
jgi:pyrroloquinoline quinone biosynthesis protein B